MTRQNEAADLEQRAWELADRMHQAVIRGELAADMTEAEALPVLWVLANMGYKFEGELDDE